jgi:hypothetical protein
MSENARKPTEKMLEFAKKLATRKGEPLPPEVAADFVACKAYLDANQILPPSEKQLAYAGNIANRKGLTIPADVAASGKLISAWIDENK